MSDHAPIIITLNIGDNQKSTLWKLNSSLLNNPQVKGELEKAIDTYFKENINGEVSPPMVWDAFKAVLRRKVISISSSLKNEDRRGLTLYTPNSENYKKIIKLDPGQTNYPLKNYKKAGGKAMKLLSYKLRKQQADATINKIRCPHTKQIHHRVDQIQQSLENYYKELYSQQKLDNEDEMRRFLESLNLPIITQEQNKALIADITEIDVNTAIARLKPHKSPGSDGFTAEWNKSFKEQLVPKLCQIYNRALKKGEIPPSWKQAIISVIPKEGKDSLDCKQFRPISVLNLDYKIYMSILARRIERLLPSLIHLDQTGFIHGRQTQDSLRRTLHITVYSISSRIRHKLC